MRRRSSCGPCLSRPADHSNPIAPHHTLTQKIQLATTSTHHAQKELLRSVSVTPGKPWLDLNHWRLLSTSETRQMGALKIMQHSWVMSSKRFSGGCGGEGEGAGQKVSDNSQ